MLESRAILTYEQFPWPCEDTPRPLKLGLGINFLLQGRSTTYQQIPHSIPEPAETTNSITGLVESTALFVQEHLLLCQRPRGKKPR